MQIAIRLGAKNITPPIFVKVNRQGNAGVCGEGQTADRRNTRYEQTLS